MRALLRPLSVPLLLLLLAGCSGDLGERLQNAAQRGAERAAEREVESRARGAVHGAFDVAENAVRCVVGDRACIERAREQGRPVAVTDEDGDVVDQIPAGGTPGSATGGVAAGDANYDFVPGERVLFATDFSGDNVGDFPRRLEFDNGVIEVVRVGDDPMLRFAEDGAFAIPLPETLPERFTIEFDLYSADDWNSVVLGTGPPDDEGKGYSCFHGDLRNHSAAEFKVGSQFETGVADGDGGTSATNQSAHEEGPVPIRIGVDGSYVKMYVGDRRVANVPNADVRRTDRILVAACGQLAPEDDGHFGPVLIDNIRIAAGGRDLYDVLQSEGRVVTEGVHFDTGSARLRAESAPALDEIARLLREHPDLRLRVEGHTDATGSADANRRLSEQRAQAVRDHLVAAGIPGSRLEAVGMGPDRPVADNATEAGRQRNRRVELVRL